jgi:diguanylate cyclase (GGDEF)-like protein
MSEDQLFEYAPISLWEDDFSEIKHALDELRKQGIDDLNEYLEENPAFIDENMHKIRVVHVNLRTLELFRAENEADLLNNLDKVFRGEMRCHFRNELITIWDGVQEYTSEGVNYALDGQPIDITLRWQVLPGYQDTYQRVLVSIEDIRERKHTENELARSEKRYRGLFLHSPISLWEEDFSQVKQTLDKLRAAGVEDLTENIAENPNLVNTCMQQIRVIDVNQRTLELFEARNLEELTSNLNRVFRDEMYTHFRDELLQIWGGVYHYEMEGVNYTLTGEPIQIQLQLAVLPGHEDNLDRVLVSIVDITARKKAEQYLRYLGTHDVLTGLYNRAYFEEERARLQRGRHLPVCILVLDVDGLKVVNDSLGHAAGDDLLRRSGEVLRSSFRAEDVVARIGGDEFAALIPDADEQVPAQSVDRIRKMIDLNNTYYTGVSLSFSIGAALGEKDSNLEAVQHLADDRMYQDKRRRKGGR